jgi:hypothetical protein
MMHQWYILFQKSMDYCLDFLGKKSIYDLKNVIMNLFIIFMFHLMNILMTS